MREEEGERHLSLIGLKLTKKIYIFFFLKTQKKKGKGQGGCSDESESFMTRTYFGSNGRTEHVIHVFEINRIDP